MKQSWFSQLRVGEGRVVFISDAHMYESQDPLKRKLAGKNTAGEKMIAKAIKDGEQRFVLTLDEGEKIEDVSLIFFGGDMVTGYGERGLTGPDSQDHIDKFKRLLAGRFPGIPRKFMAGGHELGYILPLSTDPEGGPSERSVAVFEQNFNHLFYAFNHGPYKFVVLSSDLELLQSGPEGLMKKKRLQAEFYQNEVACADRPVIIMIHDPDALASMWPFLEKHLNKITKVFSGHQHARWVNWIYPKICSVASSRILEIPFKPLFNKLFPGKADAVWAYFRNNRNNAHIWKQLNLSIIPAPGGMMGIGGGFLVADLREDNIKVRKIKAPKP